MGQNYTRTSKRKKIRKTKRDSHAQVRRNKLRSFGETTKESDVNVRGGDFQSKGSRIRFADQFRGLPEKVRRKHITELKIGDIISIAALIVTRTEETSTPIVFISSITVVS